MPTSSRRRPSTWFLFACVFYANQVNAAQGFFVEIVNQLDDDIVVQLTTRYNTREQSSKNWDTRDFASPAVLKKGEQRSFYSEACHHVLWWLECNGWATMGVEIETPQAYPWRGWLSFGFNDSPSAMVSCYKNKKHGGVFAYKEHIPIAKKGDQYHQKVVVTADGLKCD